MSQGEFTLRKWEGTLTSGLIATEMLSLSESHEWGTLSIVSCRCSAFCLVFCLLVITYRSSQCVEGEGSRRLRREPPLGLPAFPAVLQLRLRPRPCPGREGARSPPSDTCPPRGGACAPLPVSSSLSTFVPLSPAQTTRPVGKPINALPHLGALGSAGFSPVLLPAGRTHLPT